jgi:hypothetical protein
MEYEDGMVSVEAICYRCKRIHPVIDWERCFEDIWAIDGYPVITCPRCSRYHPKGSKSERHFNRLAETLPLYRDDEYERQ